MTPITRLEIFLNGIINGGEVPEPITRTEIMLNDIKNGDVVTLTPITRGECYLARISGADVQIPEPVTRVEMYLAKKCGVDINTPSPIVRIEHWLNAWASGEDPLVTLTGKIISFFSRAAKPFKSTQVAIEPVQDLHGYEAPWPPGGGVNKFNEQLTTGLLNSDGTVSDSSARLVSDFIPVVPGESYAFVWPSSSGRGRGAFYDANKDLVQYEADFPPSIIETNVSIFTVPSGAYYLRFNLTSAYGTTYNHDVSINYPSTDHSYHPYSNISPISGWTGANIYDEAEYDPDANPKVTVNFGQTVYGGTLTVNEDGSGQIVADIELFNFKNYNQSRIQSYDYNGKHGVYFMYGYGVTANRDAGVCNVAPVSTSATYDSDQYMWFGVNSNHVFWIGILDALGLTFEEFKTWIQENDVIISKRIATPITIPLTPGQIQTLVGVNTVWADTNGDTTIEVYGTPIS